MAWITPGNYFRNLPNTDPILWGLYSLSIDSIINQMEVFTHLMRQDLDRNVISSMPFSLEKIKRTSLWHYQYHRVRSFNRDRSLADFQILSQPRLLFRNLEAGWAYNKYLLCKKWPDREQDLRRQYQNLMEEEKKEWEDKNGFETYCENDPKCVLSTTSQYGTTCFIRVKADEEIYKETFEGFFEANTNKSEKFFKAIFIKYKWLVGKSDDGDDSGPGDFGGDDAPDPIDNGPGGFALNSDDDERMEILSRFLEPTMFPLTVMEVKLSNV